MTYRKIIIATSLLLCPFIAYFAFYAYAKARLNGKIDKLEKQGILCTTASLAAAHRPSPQPVLDEFNRLADALDAAPPREEREEYTAFLSRNQELFNRADAFLEAHPDLTFSRDFSNGIWDVMLPAWNTTRNWMRVNHQRINRELELGNPEAAARLFDRSVALRNYALKESYLISFLVGNVVESIRQQALFDAAENGQISRFDTATLRRWMDSMVPVEKEVRTALPLFTGSELAGQIAVTESSMQLFSDTMDPVPNRIFSAVFNPIICLDIAENFDWMERFREAASRNHLTEDYQKLDDDLRNLPGWRVASRMLMPAIPQVLRKTCGIYGRCRTLQTGLAVELYLRKYGKLPETLEELVPEFLPEVPVSPFTRKPLRYEKGKLERLVVEYQTVEFEGYRIYGGGDPEHREIGETRGDRNKALPVWNRIKEP